MTIEKWEDVRVDDLRVTLGNREVLRGISAGFQEGRLSAILGPNGAGKSTLVRAILGLVPASGSIRIRNRPLGSYGPRELARTACFVPQDTHLEFAFRVDELVMMGRYPHLRSLERERLRDHEVVETVLERLHLKDMRARDVTTLSAGERQRVLIARALATEARILLADEPVSNLDIGHRLETMEILRDVVREGSGVVVILHDIDLALRFADEVFLLSEGRLVNAGRPETIGESPELGNVFGVEIERRGGGMVFHRRTGGGSPYGSARERAEE